MATAHQIVLAARPQGKPQLTDLRLEVTEIPTPASGAASPRGAVPVARSLYARPHG